MSKSDTLPKLKCQLRNINDKSDSFKSIEERELFFVRTKARIHKEKERVRNDTGVTPLYYRRHY